MGTTRFLIYQSGLGLVISALYFCKTGTLGQLSASCDSSLRPAAVFIPCTKTLRELPGQPSHAQGETGPQTHLGGMR